MTRRGIAGIAGVVALATCHSPASGQGLDRERSVSVTGPAGRTLEREVHSNRAPGSRSRGVEVHRPGGATFQRDLSIERSSGSSRGYDAPRPFGPGPGMVVERGVVIERGRPWGGPPIGIAAPFFNFSFGRAFPPFPPPIFVAGPPVFVAAPPPPVYGSPAPVVVPTEPIPPADPLADALGRFRSGHDNSRRDGALTLGRIGDPRAVPALIDRLERDGERDVRVASAWALSEIGDPRAAVALERAALFDKRREVREAATSAYQRLARDAPTEVEAEADPDATPEAIQPRARDVPPPPPEPFPTRPEGGLVGFPDSR